MATRGRKPKPTQLRVIEGNAGRRALNREEPRPPAAIDMQPPAHLDEGAKAEWRAVAPALARIGILTTIDAAALGAYCQAFSRWRTAELALQRLAAQDASTQGLVIRTAGGNAIQNPLVGIANRAMRDVQAYAAELGMTPSARSRIKADAPETGEEARVSGYFS